MYLYELTVNAGVVRLRPEAKRLRGLVPLEEEVEKPQVFLDGGVALGRRLERPSLLLHRVLFDPSQREKMPKKKKKKKEEVEEKREKNRLKNK